MVSERVVAKLERELARLEEKSRKATDARAALPPGTSRARVTTANARWGRAAEARDRVARQLEEARAELARSNTSRGSVAATRRHPVAARAVRLPRAAPASRCERVPVCLLDVLRAGEQPTVELRGKSWAIVAGGRVQARRKEKARAEALVDVAHAELAKAATAAVPEEERRRGVLFTPQRLEGEPIYYALTEADELIASHRFSDFRPDPRFPEGVQERVYHLDESEKLKVVKGAHALKVDFLLVRSPSAVDGPPMVTEPDAQGHRLVMGGNGRTMMVQRAYVRDADSAEAYRRALIRRAPEFGLSPEDVRKMKAPVLVRVLEGLQPDAPRAVLVAAVRRTNEGLTQALDATTLGVAQGRALSTTSVGEIGKVLADQDTTLREAMASQPEVFRRALERDGILTPQNRSQWVGPEGALTPEAKDRLEAMFLGLVLGTGDRLKATAPSILRKVERAVPHLLAVRGAASSFDLSPTMQEAVDVLNDAQQRGLSVAELQAQASLFAGDERRSPEALRLAALLEGSGQRAVGEAFARWAKVAVHDPNQVMLFGAPPTPAEAFEALITGRLPNPSHRATRCRRCSGTGKVSPWAQKISDCPTCSGTGRLGGQPATARRGAPVGEAVPVSCSRCVGTGKISPWAGMISGCPTCSGTGQVVPTAPPPVAETPQERLFNPGSRSTKGNAGTRKRSRPNPPVVVESEAKTTRRLASDLRQQLREGWPARIRVHLVAATVQRTLDLRGRGAVLQVYEAGKLDLQLTADLREALRR